MALPPATGTGDPRKDKAAKQQAAQQDVFLREVDDALRQDQVEGFFRNYGKPALAVIVLGLAAFGGFLYWQHRQNLSAESDAEASVLALDAVDSNNYDEAGKRLAPVSQGKDATAAMARITLADLALTQKKVDEAARLYGEVAADASLPQPIRDLATVRQVAAQFDTMKPQDVVDRLKPLAVPGNAWFGVAGELVGMAYLAQNKPAQAGPLFAQIAKDESQPETLRVRMQQLAGTTGYDTLPDVVDAKGKAFATASAAQLVKE